MHKHTMKIRLARATWGLASLVLFLSLFFSVTSFAKTPTEPLPSDSIYQIGSTWTRQDGTSIKLADLAGRPTLVALVYTSCRASCPIIVAAMQRIERKLPEVQRAHVRFVLVTFDPARDTPEKLAAYAKSRLLDPARWTLLHGSDEAVRELSVVLGVHYRQVEGGDYAHDNVITLLDEHGVVRERSTDPTEDPTRMAQAASKLLK